jgi:ferredoxin-NADP reductase
MIIKKYKATILAIENKIEGVYTLTLTSEKGRFKYTPGQFLHFAIETEYDGASQWPDSRCFSLQSSPDEDNIKITYAVKGEFTRKMEQTLKIGSEVWVKMPYGELFENEHNKTNTVFIAGGTGVTPFLSLFTDKSFEEYINPRIYLGFRSREYNLYESELNNAKNSNINLQYTYNELIDIEKIFFENGIDASYFISGPPIMIKLFKNYLLSKHVDNTNILTDDWE